MCYRNKLALPRISSLLHTKGAFTRDTLGFTSPHRSNLSGGSWESLRVFLPVIESRFSRRWHMAAYGSTQKKMCTGMTWGAVRCSLSQRSGRETTGLGFRSSQCRHSRSCCDYAKRGISHAMFQPMTMNLNAASELAAPLPSPHTQKRTHITHLHLAFLQQLLVVVSG